MLVFTTNCSPMSQKWEEPLTRHFTRTSYQLGSNYGNTPLKLNSKRSLQNPDDDPQCMIHRQTLAELYMILKEEADVFEECLENVEQSGFKRTEKRSVGTDECSLYRETLTELFEIVQEEAKSYDECLMRDERNKKSLFLL